MNIDFQRKFGGEIIVVRQRARKPTRVSDNGTLELADCGRARSRLRAIVAVCVLAVHSLILPGPVMADERMPIELLAAAVEQQLSSITSLDVEYVYTWEPDELLVQHRGAKTKEREAEWAEQGDWRLLEEFLPTSPRRLAAAHVFDGEKGYHYNVPSRPGRAEMPPRLHISGEIGAAYQVAVIPAYLIGRRLSSTDLSLFDAMRLTTAVEVGAEAIDGNDCYRVEVKFSTRGQPLKLVAYLDPSHDYLPARIAMAYDTDELRSKGPHQVWDMTDFMRVRDAADGKERWFPRVATLTQAIGGTYVLLMKSVKINETLERKHFRVDVPDGTIVTDSFAPEGQEQWVVGGPAAAQRLVKRAAEQVKSALKQNANTDVTEIDARPLRRSRTRWLLAGVFVAFGAAVLFWIRSR